MGEQALDLEVIVQRAYDEHVFGEDQDEWYSVAVTDFEALVGEVRRLRAALEAVRRTHGAAAWQIADDALGARATPLEEAERD